MSSRRSTRAAPPQPVSSAILLLDDDAQVEVLRAAEAAGALAALASSSEQLCRLARNRLALKLRVENQEQASLVLQSWAACRPPFSACTQLYLAASRPTGCLLAVGVLNAARQWPDLEQLELRLWPCEDTYPQHPNPVLVDHTTSAVLSMVPALGSLRQLKLDIMGATLGAASMQHVGQLVQLTKLELSIDNPAVNPVDLTALSGLTNLIELYLPGPAAVQPAAGPEGPFSLPTSLVRLELGRPDSSGYRAGPVPGWYTHLPGCPQLQHLEVRYGSHPSQVIDPGALVTCLAQHNRQLRSLAVHYHAADFEVQMDWGLHPEGMLFAYPVAWHPDASLAALTGLECLSASQLLDVQSAAHWRHLAQLTALSKLEEAEFSYAPPPLLRRWQEPGPSLAVVELEGCSMSLAGDALGRLLLACPALQRAGISISRTPAPLALPAAGPALPPHPNLRALRLDLEDWYCGGGSAAAHFAALVPVLAGLQDLTLHEWPQGTAAGPDQGTSQLPDLSACGALTSLFLTCSVKPLSRVLVSPHEDFLSMLAPMQQLQRLEVVSAPGLNARAVVPLQYMVPQLQWVRLRGCGKLVPVVVNRGFGQDQEVNQQQVAAEAAQLLESVRQLLRPGLVLEVYDTVYM